MESKPLGVGYHLQAFHPMTFERVLIFALVGLLGAALLLQVILNPTRPAVTFLPMVPKAHATP